MSLPSPTPTLLATYRAFADPEKILSETQLEDRKVRSQANLLAQKSRERRQAAVASRRRELDEVEIQSQPNQQPLFGAQPIPFGTFQPTQQPYQSQPYQQTQPIFAQPMQPIFAQPMQPIFAQQTQPYQPIQQTQPVFAQPIQQPPIQQPEQDFDRVPPILDHFPDEDVKQTKQDTKTDVNQTKKEEDNASELQEAERLANELRENERRKNEEKVKQEQEKRRYWDSRGEFVRERALANASSVLVMGTSLFESVTNAINFHLLRTNGLADNIEIALEQKKFDSYIEEMVSIEWIKEILGSASTGALALFANIIMHTHKDNMQAIEGGYRSTKPKKNGKENKQEETQHCSCHNCSNVTSHHNWNPTAHLGGGTDLEKEFKAQQEAQRQKTYQEEQRIMQSIQKELESKIKKELEEKTKEIDNMYKQAMETRMKELEMQMRKEWEAKMKQDTPSLPLPSAPSYDSVHTSSISANTTSSSSSSSSKQNEPQKKELKTQELPQKQNVSQTITQVVDPVLKTPRPTFSSQTTFTPLIAPQQVHLANKILGQMTQEAPTFAEKEPDSLGL